MLNSSCTNGMWYTVIYHIGHVQQFFNRSQFQIDFIACLHCKQSIIICWMLGWRLIKKHVYYIHWENLISKHKQWGNLETFRHFTHLKSTKYAQFKKLSGICKQIMPTSLFLNVFFLSITFSKCFRRIQFTQVSQKSNHRFI